MRLRGLLERNGWTRNQSVFSKQCMCKPAFFRIENGGSSRRTY